MAELRPYRGRITVGGTGTGTGTGIGVLGSVDHLLGVLLQAAGDRDAAELLRAGLRADKSAGFRPTADDGRHRLAELGQD